MKERGEVVEKVSADIERRWAVVFTFLDFGAGDMFGGVPGTSS